LIPWELDIIAEIKAMDNRTLAARLASRAHALETERASLFRVRAYRRAAETILGLDVPVEMLIEQGGRDLLAELPGIGRSLSRTIEALMRGEDVAE
jgi:DNA polymerase (family 10)